MIEISIIPKKTVLEILTSFIFPSEQQTTPLILLKLSGIINVGDDYLREQVRKSNNNKT